MAKAKSSTKTTKATTSRKKAMEADAKAKVEKLHQMESEHKHNDRVRHVALVVSLFLNLTFLVAIYAIICNQR